MMCFKQRGCDKVLCWEHVSSKGRYQKDLKAPSGTLCAECEPKATKFFMTLYIGLFASLVILTAVAVVLFSRIGAA